MDFSMLILMQLGYQQILHQKQLLYNDSFLLALYYVPTYLLFLTFLIKLWLISSFIAMLSSFKLAWTR